jgi:hypothetical protein
VKEILEEPITGCPGAYGKYMIEDLQGQFMAYSIGGWFLEKVSLNDQKLLEEKDQKIGATSALNAESLSKRQFDYGQHGFTPSAIEDNCSAIEDNCSAIEDNCSAIEDNCSAIEDNFSVIENSASSNKTGRSIRDS